MEDKYTEIERENRILLEKITNIMSKPVTGKTSILLTESRKRKKQVIEHNREENVEF